MRFIATIALVLLFGCLGVGEEQNKSVNFSESLAFEDIASDSNKISELDTSAADAVFEGMILERENVSVIYFYSPECAACKLLEQWLRQEKKKYNASVVWFEYDISTADGWEKYLLFSDAYGVPKNESYVPVAYVGGTYYWGLDGIRNELPKKIEECRINGCYSPFELLKD